MTARDHAIRQAAAEIDEIVEYLLEDEPHLAAQLADALMTLMPDTVDRFMPVAWARSHDNF